MALFDKIGSLSKINFDDLYNTFLSLEKKQQMAVTTGIIVVVLLILLLPVSCVSSKLSTKKEVYEKATQDAADFYRVVDEYFSLKSRFDQSLSSESLLGGDPLKTTLYKITDALTIERQRVMDKKINPVEEDLFTEVGKEVTIRNLPIEMAIKVATQLVQNQEPPISVKKLTLQVDPKNKQMIKSMTFTMTTLQIKGQKSGDVKTEEKTDEKAPTRRPKTGNEP